MFPYLAVKSGTDTLWQSCSPSSDNFNASPSAELSSNAPASTGSELAMENLKCRHLLSLSLVSVVTLELHKIGNCTLNVTINKATIFRWFVSNKIDGCSSVSKKTCWLVKQLIAEQTAAGSEDKDDIGDHHHKRVYWSFSLRKTTIDKKSSWTFGFCRSRSSCENDVSYIEALWVYVPILGVLCW